MKRLFCLILIVGIAAILPSCSDKSEKQDNDIVGIWKASVDGVTYYYDFSDDGGLTVYADSYTLKMAYTIEDDDDCALVTVPMPSDQFGNVGAIISNKTGEFTVTGGSTDDSDRTAELVYSQDDSQEITYTLDEVEEASPVSVSAPKVFKEDKQLTGSWINNYSNEQGNQHMEFFDDGNMIIVENYDNNGVTLEITRDCTYTANDGTAIITYCMGEETSAPVEYKINGNLLTFGEMEFTREGTQTQKATDATEKTE